MTRLLSVCLALLALSPSAAMATSIAYFTDDELFDMAEVVMVGVVWRRDVDRSGYPRTEYEVEAEECFKGCKARNFVTMSYMGAPADELGPNDEWVMGMPAPKTGSRIIVYLYRSPTGRLVPISMGLSQFTVFYHPELKRHIAHREVDEVAIFLPAASPTAKREGRADSYEVAIPRDVLATDVVESLRKKRARR